MPTTKNSMMRRALMGLGLAGAAAAALGAPARGQTAAARWQPASEPQDAWLESGGRHRMVFDTLSFEGLGKALAFGGNFYAANKSAYGVGDADLAVVIILRSLSAPFGFTDAMWAKYGPAFSERLKLADPGTRLHNPYQAADKDGAAHTLDALAQKGARFAICATATHGLAAMIAAKTGAAPEAVFAELTANLIRNGVMVPAGIVALGRAQEHGYAFSYAG